MIGPSIPKGGMHTFLQDVSVKGKTLYTLSSQITIWKLNNAKVQIILHYFDVNNKLIGSDTPFENGGKRIGYV